MTPVWGLTQGGRKRTGRDPRVLPASVIYDPELTLTLPVAMSVTSGMNAIAHAVEALYAPDATPVISLMAEEGVRALTGALPTLVRPRTTSTRAVVAQYGAWLCGACLGATTMSLHHKLCHRLGGTLDLPHAAATPWCCRTRWPTTRPRCPTPFAALSRALGGADDPAPATVGPRRRTRGLPFASGSRDGRNGHPEEIVEQVAGQPVRQPGRGHRAPG